MDFSDYDAKGKYCITDEHDMEILDDFGLEVELGVGLDLDGVELIDNHVDVDVDDDVDDDDNDGAEVTVSGGELSVLNEVEFIDSIDLEGCEKQETQEKREINRKSVGDIKNEKHMKICDITVELREVELSINTSSVEEVIFKKHRVEIINKQTHVRIMEGVVSGYTLVGRAYDPDIVIDFDDGRSFYNENFGYLMRFYI